MNDADSQGFTALHCASQEGHVAIVDILLEAGATVDQAKGERRHPTLHRLPDRQAESRQHGNPCRVRLTNGPPPEPRRGSSLTESYKVTYPLGAPYTDFHAE